MVCPIPQGDHNKVIVKVYITFKHGATLPCDVSSITIMLSDDLTTIGANDPKAYVGNQ